MYTFVQMTSKKNIISKIKIKLYIYIRRWENKKKNDHQWQRVFQTSAKMTTSDKGSFKLLLNLPILNALFMLIIYVYSCFYWCLWQHTMPSNVKPTASWQTVQHYSFWPAALTLNLACRTLWFQNTPHQGQWQHTTEWESSLPTFYVTNEFGV